MKYAPSITLIVALWCSCVGCRAQIGNTAQEGCSAAMRGRSDKASVASFVSKIWSSQGLVALNPAELIEFRWADLAGDGKCELVFTTWGAAFTNLYIEWQDNSQVLQGEANLRTKVAMKKTFLSSIRDLDGDGKKEIIMDSYLGAGGRRGANPTPEWPQVYRLHGEKYVPASKDFPDYYENEILPDLNQKITSTPQSQNTVLAALEMQRDKIQRVLGINLDAGLGEARQWATSKNPEMIENAMIVFRDIPGHEDEANAAEKAWKQAQQLQREPAQ